MLHGQFRVVEGAATPLGSWYVETPSGRRYGPFSERGAHHEAELYAKMYSPARQRRRPQKLITSQQTSRAEKAVRSAAAAKFGRGRASLVYEHGQWWATVWNPHDEEDETYSAVDTSSGVDFERV